ncbi:MAG: NYN domain-containing protein [Verrucomicrobium sp.]|nr:NYN domain-containing protein [Verrucomicrobium sp.]
MARPLLIDGHSVLYAWPELRALHQRNPRQARETLIAHLRRFHDAGNWNVTLIYDGQTGGPAMRGHPGDMEVFYSKAGQSADSIIEALVARHAQPGEITVITADGGERSVVEGLGAFCMSPDWLKMEIESVLGDFEEELRRFKGR